MSKYLPNQSNKKSNLALLRKEKQLTQAQLSDKLGLTAKTYRDYELGKQLPKTDMLITMADYFNVSTDFILGRSNCRGVDNDYIHNKLGLDDNAINQLASWNKYEHDMITGADVLNEDGTILFHGIPQQLHYRAIVTLNELFKDSLDFEMLLRSVQDLFNTQYRYPIYHTEQSEVITDKDGKKLLTAQTVVPNSEMDNIKGNPQLGFDDIPLLNLAKDKNTPWDNYSIPLDDTFFESVAIKGIEKTLIKIREYLKHIDDK